MEVIKVAPINQRWVLPKDVAQIFGYRSPTKLLRNFRRFCQDRPDYFKPYVPYKDLEGSDTIYNVFCIAHWFENEELLMAGSRSIKFQDDLMRIKEIYG